MSTHRTTLAAGLATAGLATAGLAVVALTVTACAAAAPPTGADAAGTSSSTAPTPSVAVSTSAPRSVEPERSTPAVPTSADPALAQVDRTSIDAVATAVVTAFSTADTTTDAGPNDAAARTVSLLTADYAAGIVTAPPVRSPGAQWNTWTTQGVRLTAIVQALPDDHPADTATTATRIYLLTQTPTTGTGQVLAPVVTVAYVGLVRTTAGWSVAQVEQR